jgi:hypothetical protein
MEIPRLAKRAEGGGVSPPSQVFETNVLGHVADWPILNRT